MDEKRGKCKDINPFSHPIYKIIRFFHQKDINYKTEMTPNEESSEHQSEILF